MHISWLNRPGGMKVTRVNNLDRKGLNELEKFPLLYRDSSINFVLYLIDESGERLSGRSVKKYFVMSGTN